MPPNCCIASAFSVVLVRNRKDFKCLQLYGLDLIKLLLNYQLDGEIKANENALIVLGDIALSSV